MDMDEGEREIEREREREREREGELGPCRRAGAYVCDCVTVYMMIVVPCHSRSELPKLTASVIARAGAGAGAGGVVCRSALSVAALAAGPRPWPPACNALYNVHHTKPPSYVVRSRWSLVPHTHTK